MSRAPWGQCQWMVIRRSRSACVALSLLLAPAATGATGAAESQSAPQTESGLQGDVTLQLAEVSDLPESVQKSWRCFSVAAPLLKTPANTATAGRPPAKVQTSLQDSNAPCTLKIQDLKALQSALLENYSLPGDLAPQLERERPIDWVDPKAAPERALLVGTPVRLKRKTSEMVLPVFPLADLVFFQGNSLSISKLNTAIDYWSQGKPEAGLAVLDELVDAVKDQPVGDHERMAIYLARAHLHLEFYLNRLNGNGKTAGEGGNDKPAEVWKSRARADFEQGILEPKLFSYLHSAETTFDPETYVKTFENAVFVHEQTRSQLAKLKAPRAKRTLSPLVWVRSVAPSSVFTLMSLTRVKGQLSKSFSAAERLEALAETLQQPLETLTISVPPVSTMSDVPSVGKPRFVRPTHIRDALAIAHFVRAIAQEREPLPSLLAADKGIRTAQSPALAALGFGLMAQVYFDLRNDLWAKRLYAWSEIMDPAQRESFPDVTLWGAEAALWRGLFLRSQTAFLGLRDSLSDPVFGADVHLRLLQFDLLQGNTVSAQTRMETLRTHYNRSHVAADVVTLDFCANAPAMTERVRKVEYQRVMDRIKEGRLDLREQARACLLSADLKKAEEDSRKANAASPSERSGRWARVATQAQQQRELIEAYRKDFPDSPYLVLFQTRDERLKLGPIFESLERNDCPSVLQFYLANEKALWATASSETLKGAQSQSLDRRVGRKDTTSNGKSHPAPSPAPVEGLVWSTAEMNKVIRCSAFQNELALWGRLREKGGSDANVLREAVFRWRTTKAEQQLTHLRDALVQQVGWQVFDEKLPALDAISTATLADESFWVILGVLDVLTQEPPLASSRFFDAPMSAVTAEKNVERIALGSQLCSWSQKALSAPPEARKPRIKSFLASHWLEGVRIKGGLTLGPPQACLTRLTALMISASTGQPTPQTDEEILWPYVEKIGPLVDPELAFALADRSYQREGQALEPIVHVYESLAKGAKDAALRRAAKSWLKQNVNREKPRVW